MDKFLSLFSSKKTLKKRYENCVITTPINIEYHNSNDVNFIIPQINNVLETESLPQENNNNLVKEVEKVIPQQLPIKDEVVVVNNFDRTKKIESVYNQKYSQKISELKLVQIIR
jgi:hypothetical protein